MHIQTSHGEAQSLAFSLTNAKRVFEWFLGALKARLDHATKRRQALREFRLLLAMSDYLLRDIGLTRAEVLADRLRFTINGELPDYIG